MHHAPKRRALAALLTLAALSACQDSTISAPVGGGGKASAAVGVAETIYGPEQFVRGTGAPEHFERTISTDGYEGPFILHVRSGDVSGAHPVSTATVSFNGMAVLTADTFRKKATEWAIPVNAVGGATLELSLAGAPGSILEISLEGVRRGIRVCRTGNGIANLADAVRDAEDGATIRLCDGTHPVHDLHLGDRSLTIEAEHPGRAVLDGSGGGSVLDLSHGRPTSHIELRGLVLTGSAFSSIQIGGNYGRLRVVDVEFRPIASRPYGTILGYNAGLVASNAEGSGITIDSSRFIGGDIGVNASLTAGIVLRHNTFVDQSNAAIHVSEGSLTAEDNDIHGCGPNWCILLMSGTHVLQRNAVTVDIARPTVNVIQMGMGSFTMTSNVITGTGGARSPEDPSTWPINAGITPSGQVTVVGNHISGAWTGLGFGNANGTATDNVISDVGSVMMLYLSSVQVHRNDFSNYARAFRFVAQATNSLATCNWWGSASGPHDPNAFEFVYTPFATQPIAGTSVACEPGTVAWTAGTPMPTARQGAATAQENGKLYVIGGNTGTGAGNGEVLATLEAYDPVSDTWTTLAPMPSPRFQTHGAVQIGGNIYVAGGRSCSCIPGGNTSTLFIYNVFSNTWSRGPDMPVSGSVGVSAAIGNKLYVLNGHNGGSRTDFWMFDPARAVWTQLPSAPASHAVGAAAVVNGKLYVAGGEVLSNRLDVYDPQTNSWSQAADLPVGWQHMAAASMGSQLFLFGGVTSDGAGPNGVTTRAAVYNAEQNRWFDLPSMAVPRNVLTGGSIPNGTLVAIGGATWNPDGTFRSASSVVERIHVN